MQDLCRTVKQSWGIKELCLLKSHWLVSAVINYERQTGWCSQMKQNMFGCAAQPSNDAGKQKDNCPLRWLWKSLWRDVTWRLRCASAIAKRRRIRKGKKERKKGTWWCTWAGDRLDTILQPCRRVAWTQRHMASYQWSPCWLEEWNWETGSNRVQEIWFLWPQDLVGQRARRLSSPPGKSIADNKWYVNI